MYHRHEEAFQSPQPLIPFVAQPQGPGFFWGTFAGRLIVLNSLMFLITIWLSGKGLFANILSSDIEVLLSLGAKDGVRLASGEYWRLLTPIFLHSGLIHFAFNNWALYSVAYQMEFQLGPKLFLLLYLGSGLAGNVASSVRSMALSVGASGALFGLLGFGFYLERLVQSRIEAITGQRPKAGAYTGMVIANVIFGLLIPQIDNAAHIGGLVFGVVFGAIWVRFIPNRLQAKKRKQATFLSLLLGGLLIGGIGLGSSERYVRYRLESAILDSHSAPERFLYLGRLLEISPENLPYRVHRLKLGLLLRQLSSVYEDIDVISRHPDGLVLLDELERELSSMGAAAEREKLRELRSKLPVQL